MIGETIGTYTVISTLGQGGMGVVYLARHTTLGRLAAVKVLQPQYCNDRDMVSRFFKEARAATAIRHHGIVEVYDFGFIEGDAGQRAYIIMEYLDGESLAARLKRGPLAIPVALMIARGIAKSLHAAHEQGIVHRDLKPDNIFVIPDDDAVGGERVKLLDFGIAKLTRDPPDGSRTDTGAVMGTPRYMAPEQCRGLKTIDARADLYSLGCVVYEMLAGRPPFVGDAAADLIAHQLYFVPERLRDVRLEVSPGVDELVMQLLAKVPDDRPASAADVAARLDDLLPETETSHELGVAVTEVPAKRRAASEVEAVASPGRRRPIAIAVGIAAVAIGVGSFVLVSHANDSAPADALVAVVDEAGPVETHAPIEAMSIDAPAIEPAVVDAGVPDDAPIAAAKHRATSAKPPAKSVKPSDPAKPAEPVCTVASFQTIIDQDAAAEADVQAALARLKQCKAALGVRYSELQHLLIGKL